MYKFNYPRTALLSEVHPQCMWIVELHTRRFRNRRQCSGMAPSTLAKELSDQGDPMTLCCSVITDDTLRTPEQRSPSTHTAPCGWLGCECVSEGLVKLA